MEAILDELRVAEDGRIYVSVILPNRSAEPPDIMATLDPHTAPWDRIACDYLPCLERSLGLQPRSVKGIVHGGGDVFTVITAEGDYREVRVSDCPSALEAIKSIAHLVAVPGAAEPNPIRQQPPQRRRTRTGR